MRQSEARSFLNSLHLLMSCICVQLFQRKIISYKVKNKFRFCIRNKNVTTEAMVQQRIDTLNNTKITNAGDCQIQNLGSIIMKTKPNFTYKEFIEKISQGNVPSKDPVQSKSPRVLKNHNKNIPSSSFTYNDKPFQNKTHKNPANTNKSPTFNLTPRRNTKKQNLFYDPNKSTNVKNQTNNKFQLKNNLNTDRLASRQQSMKSSKKIQNYPNFSYNQSCYENQRHNESCSTFYKNFNYDNEEDNFNNHGISINKSSSINYRVKNKKNSTGSIDGKLKVLTKGNVTNRDGNLTDRNGKRIVTQYEENRSPIVTDRLNTQYDRLNNRHERESPSFYKMSMDESSFLDFQQDKSHRNLFNESSLFGAKKSTVSLTSQQKSIKTNQKSYQHVYNKFMTTISQILFQITKIQDQTKLLEHKVKYIEFLQCLKELKMIKSDYEPYSQCQGVDMVKQFWQQLVMGHNINHFIIIVALILKITPNQQIKGQNSMQMQNCIYLQKKYEKFRSTRLQLDRSKNLTDKQPSQHNNFPFKPTISKNSQDIIQKSKSKQKKFKINTSVNHNNENSQIHKKRENISINTEFQNHNQSVTSRSIRTTSPLGNKRSQILYKQAKKKSLEKRQNKSTIDYQYQKNKEQLTFKPKIIIKRKKQPTQEIQNNYLSPRVMLDQQKAINRIIRGRVQKQVKQITIDRGIPYNQKTIQKLRKQKFEQIIKEHQQSRIKKQQQSQCKLKVSQVQNKKQNNYERCTTQVQNLQNILNLSFQGAQKDVFRNQQDNNEKGQNFTTNIQQSPLRTQNQQQQNPMSEQKNYQYENAPQDYFTLDIYFEHDKSQKLMIKRDSTIQQVVLEAQRFIQKHDLPKQMQQKLKQQLMIAMKFHDIEKIQENDEEQECSLLG